MHFLGTFICAGDRKLFTVNVAVTLDYVFELLGIRKYCGFWEDFSLVNFL